MDSLHVRLKQPLRVMGLTRKRSTKRLKHTENQFRKRLQLKGVSYSRLKTI